MEFEKIYTDAIIPTRNSIGYDIYTYDGNVLDPKQRCIISTGVRMKFPKGISGYLVPLNEDVEDYGLDILNGMDYFDDGCLQIIVMNHGDERILIKSHTIIAKLVLSTPFKFDTVTIR